MKLWSPPEANEGFELTPMIDVVFLLIAFFMTITSQISKENIKIEIPVAQEAVVPEDKGLRQTVTVDSSGSLYFGTIEVSPEELVTRIREVVAARPETRVYVRADAGTAHRHVQAAMRATAEAGLSEVIFASNQE